LSKELFRIRKLPARRFAVNFNVGKQIVACLFRSQFANFAIQLIPVSSGLAASLRLWAGRERPPDGGVSMADFPEASFPG
jgi:hypothetical protein